MLLTRKATSAAASSGRLSRNVTALSRQHHRSPHVPQAFRPCGRRRRCRKPAAVFDDGQGQGRGTGGRRQDRGQTHSLHALLGRLCDRCRGAKRRLDPPGTGVRFADQPRRALRQGRVDPRTRPRRASPQVPDETRRRQMEEDQLGRSAERSQRRSCSRSRKKRGPTRRSGSARASTTTSSRICSASSCRSSAPTTWTTRRASATRRRWRVSRTPGAMAR